jgi:hypothetical protein
MRTDDDINVSLIQFGSTATLATPFTKLASFESSLINKSSLCGSDMEATNYEAAFKKAKESFASIEGNKVIFLISDGLPTAYDGFTPSTPDEPEAQAKGLAAAKDLLASVKSLDLDVVYLGGENKDAAVAYLGTITGDPAKVKVADNAGVLAEKIVELSIPSASLDTTTVSAEIMIGDQKTPLKITKITADPTKKSVWTFESEEFSPIGKAGASSVNQVIVKVLDKTKTEYSQTIKINFTQE